MKFTLSRRELLASMLFASTDDSRYTLCGVLIETHIGNRPTLITTDGRRLAVIETTADQSDPDSAEAAFLLRSEILRPLCALSKALGGKTFPWIEFTATLGNRDIGIAFVGSKCSIRIEDGIFIDGAYPNWRKVLPPKKAPRRPISDLGINSDFMADFSKAAKIMESASPVLQMNLIGQDDAIEVRITTQPNFYALLMPCKTDDSLEYQPEFVSIVKDLPVKQEAEKESEEEAELEGKNER